ncbi:MAG: sterol desaturase family protein [Proteobacteria bacterium]|uniref:sterol desaturase family protein n=1 Tax=Rudaea sp. TaxID=2136325 RepID=UPI00322086B2|nr:sterol desaturase family protein [Pseudomonadota bacterium]
MINPILIAGPGFVALIGAEYLYGRIRGRNTYRLNDALNALAMGTMSQLMPLLVSLGVYALVLRLVPWRWPTDHVWVWIVALLFYDLCYYWFHRISHERSLFWASHVAHHQSERYNLSTALRQTSTGFLGFVFYLPMALAGVPLEMFAVVGLIDLYYQYWIHTEHVGKLGWFDRVFASPSNHRVHHAVNDRYVDKNYGGLLIVWDRLFGTFVEEHDEDPTVFGTRAPLRSWNPLWANAEVYAAMLGDAWRARRWRDKAYILIARTGWRPADVAERWPKPAFDIRRAEYDPPLSRAVGGYCLVQSLVLIGLALYLLTIAASLGTGARWAAVACLFAGFTSLGWLMEGRRFAPWLELVRLAASGLVAFWWLPEPRVVLGICVASAIGWIITWRLPSTPSDAASENAAS